MTGSDQPRPTGPRGEELTSRLIAGREKREVIALCEKDDQLLRQVLFRIRDDKPVSRIVVRRIGLIAERLHVKRGNAETYATFLLRLRAENIAKMREVRKL